MYLALYRKYRPRTFDDVISQEHITTTLKNQIKNGSAAHAYLFTGSRGTGKTTCAKILAAAVNCLSPKDGNPCLECESCREILNGSATDIVEMDAASNRGVDDVRQLRDEVSYSPVSCKYRVYIIDEVHMLTPEAFNALLKTLEEPPEHVKFILATTELHKVPATIVSRCQRFEFRRIDAAQSAERLLEVAEKEGAQLDEDAALLISRLSDGGMRDALSLLDRCVSSEKHVTAEAVRDCAGVADDKYLFEFSQMIANGDVGGCIRLLSELHKASKDMALIVDELSLHFRDLMLCKTAPEDKSLLSCMPNEYEDAAKRAEMFSLGDILRCLTLLRECADGMGKTRQRKTFAEMCFVKMCTGASADSGERAVSKRAEYRAVQPQKEEFIPTPPEKMSRESRYNLSRLREVTKEVINLNSAESNLALSEEKTERPAEKVSDKDAPLEAPPFPEEPPGSYERENELSSGESAKENALSEAEVTEENVGNSPESEADVKEIPETDGETSEKAEDNPPKRSGVIPNDEWKGIIEKCDFLSQTLLKDSQAEFRKDALVVKTNRTFLLKNAEAENLKELQKAISEALGYDVKIRIEKLSDNSSENLSEAEKLLQKAGDMGIDIRIS